MPCVRVACPPRTQPVSAFEQQSFVDVDAVGWRGRAEGAAMTTETWCGVIMCTAMVGSVLALAAWGIFGGREQRLCLRRLDRIIEAGLRSHGLIDDDKADR